MKKSYGTYSKIYVGKKVITKKPSLLYVYAKNKQEAKKRITKYNEKFVKHWKKMGAPVRTKIIKISVKTKPKKYHYI